MFLCAVPDYPILNGTSCYSATNDGREGKVNATIQLSVHSGWKSLAPVASIRGVFSLMQPRTRIVHPLRMPITITKRKTYLMRQTIKASSNCKEWFKS